MKVLKAGSLTYESGNFLMDGWEFGPSGEGEPIDPVGMVIVCLQYILDERTAYLPTADQRANIRTLNAERIMIDTIQQAKK